MLCTCTSWNLVLFTWGLMYPVIAYNDIHNGHTGMYMSFYVISNNFYHFSEIFIVFAVYFAITHMFDKFFLWNFKNNFGFICYKWFCLEYSKNAHALISLSISSYLIENAKYHSPWMQGKESHEDLQTYIFDFFFNLPKTIAHECRERKIIKIKNTHFWFFKWDV